MATVHLSGSNTSTEVLEQLARTPVNIDGYFLLQDEHGVWVTNPYGVDCALLSATPAVIEKFMDNLRNDFEYGPVPH